MRIARSLLGGRTAIDRDSITAAIFFDGPGEFRPYVRRLVWLTALSTVIAAFGLIANSPAVVIGAMLVAPLMQPIIGFAAGVALGNAGREAVSLALIALVTVESAVVAMLVGWVVPVFRVITVTDELAARTRPALLDLGIALAAGAAGAYVTVRPRAGGAIAGAAIAVALAPPLAAFGILFVRGNDELAVGALLLFLTNLIGIVIAASGVFFVAGLFDRADRGRWRRAPIVLPLTAVLAIAYPLAQRSIDNLHLSTDEARIRRLLVPELRAEGLGIQSIAVIRQKGRTIASLDVTGPSAPPDAGAIAARLSGELRRPVRVILRWTQRDEFTAQAEPPGG